MSLRIRFSLSHLAIRLDSAGSELLKRISGMVTEVAIVDDY